MPKIAVVIYKTLRISTSYFYIEICTNLFHGSKHSIIQVEARLIKNLHMPFGRGRGQGFLEEEVSFAWDECILDGVFECDLKIVAAAVLSFHTPLVAILIML